MNELARYLVEYFPELMTEQERQALFSWKLEYKANAASSELMKNKIRESIPKDAKVKELLKDGIAVFGNNVKNRILSENPDVFINRCPQCNSIARTPRAKQCPKCFIRW